ncbi:hypothetical protein HDV00_008298 [Rhizophlyctis rosea]|nr:hypothetical protein HDV00_008298 [Rhizophlyctis rosea]
MESIHFTFIDPKDALAIAWRQHIESKLSPEDRTKFSVIHGRIDDAEGPFDCIVSPANSYGIMDGAADLVISRLFANDGDINEVIQHVQKKLYEVLNGYQPPGTAHLIPMHPPFTDTTYNLKFIAHCPTMRVPDTVTWDKEVVYKCFWSLLNVLHRHNTANPTDPIRSVVCFGLGTGVGRIPADVCAAQMVLAYKHFVEGLRRGFGKGVDWREAYRLDDEIAETTKALKDLK